MKIINHLYGDYICRASNILGTTETTITVYGKYCFHKHMYKIVYVLICLA